MSCEAFAALTRQADRLLAHKLGAMHGKEWWGSTQKYEFERKLLRHLATLVWPVVRIATRAILYDEGIYMRQIDRAYYVRRISYVNPPVYYRKLRTMVEDAHDQETWLVEEWGSLQRLKESGKDPRITRVGHVLRNTSIDELPQIPGVYNGELDFVGPRAPGDG